MRAQRTFTSVIAALVLLIAACGSDDDGSASETTGDAGNGNGSGEAPEVEQVDVAINFTMQPVFAPLAYGAEHGVFEEHGFDIDIIPTQGSDEVMNYLNTGNVDYAISDYDAYATQLAEGLTDVSAVYVWLDVPSLGLLTTEPLEGPEDLEGLTFATTGFSAGRELIPHIMEENGADSDALTVETLDFSALYPSLFQGEIDAAEIHSPGSWRNVEVTAEEQEQDVYLTLMSDWGFESYEKIILVSERAMQDPDQVERFVAAAAESLELAMEEATGEDIFDLVREDQPTAEPDAVAQDWEDFKDLLGTPGEFDEEEIQRMLDRLVAVGAIEEAPDASETYDNQFVPGSS